MKRLLQYAVLSSIVATLAGCRAAPIVVDETARAMASAPMLAADASPVSFNSSNGPIAQAAYEGDDPAGAPLDLPDLPRTKATSIAKIAANPEAIPAPLPSEPPPPTAFTLEELEAMALAKNPAVAEAAALVHAAQGNYVQVGLPPNPTAGYSGVEIGDSGRAGQQGAFVGREFITGNKLGLNRAVAASQVQQAEQQWSAARHRVLTDVRMGYYELLIAQERLAMTERLATISGQAVSAVEALLQAQEAAGIDLLQAKVEANTAKMLVENASAGREGAWRRLTAVMGDPDMPLANVAGNAADDLPTVEFDAALARLVAESPQLAATFSEIDRARWAVERARAEVIPNVDVQALAQYDYATEDAIAGVQIGMPLPIFNRNQGGIQRAYGELHAAEQASQRTELSLRRQLVEVYQRYVTARQQVDRYGQDILPGVNETLQLTNEGYQAGEFGFLQLLTVQRTYFQTHLAYLAALEQMWSASREIEGLLLRDSLDSGSGLRGDAR